MWKRQGFALPSPSRRALAHRHHHGGSPQRSGHTAQQRNGHAGTNGEGGDLRREPAVTLSKSHPRSTMSTRGGSAPTPTESPNVITSHICGRALLSSSPLSVRTVCVPMGWRFHFHFTISRSFRVEPGVSHVHCRSSYVPAPLNEFSHGGYAVVRLREARNPGPATHERDRAAGERIARQRRINEAGDSVPRSQDSITRTDTPATQTTLAAPAPPPMPNSRRPPQPQARQQQEYLRCAQCAADPEASSGTLDRGLMLHMFLLHGGQQLIQEKCCSAAPGAIAAVTAKGILQPETSLLVTSSKTADNLDTRVLRPLACPPPTILLTAQSQFHQVTPSMTHSRAAPFGTSLPQNATSGRSPIFAEPQQCPSHAAQSLATPQPGQKASREPPVAISPGPRCADIAAACGLLRCQKALAEMRIRLQLREAGETSDIVGRVLGQQHSGSLRRTTRVVQPQTDEQRGKRACALTAGGSISKAKKGLVGGVA